MRRAGSGLAVGAPAMERERTNPERLQRGEDRIGGCGERFTQRLGVEPRHRHRAVAIDHDARRAIAFAVAEPVGVRVPIAREVAPARAGGRDALPEERRAEFLALSP